MAHHLEPVVAALHAANRAQARLHWLCCTAGTSLYPTLMGVAGASSSITAAFVPYSQEETRQFLGSRGLRSVCSPTTASAAADAARIRATQTELSNLSADHVPNCSLCTGVASQAALATSRSLKGELRAFVSVVDASSEWQLRVRFASEGSRALERAAQDETVALLMLWVLAMNSGLEPSHVDAVAAAVHATGMPALRRPEWSDLIEGNSCTSPSASAISVEAGALADGLELIADCGDSDTQRSSTKVFLGKRRVDPGLKQLLDGVSDTCVVLPATTASTVTPAATAASASSAESLGTGAQVLAGSSLPPHSVVLCGSFNPLHGGHEALLNAAVTTARHELSLTSSHGGDMPELVPVLEMSVTNADKGCIDSHSVRRRVEQISGPIHTISDDHDETAAGALSLREEYPASVTGVSGKYWPMLLTHDPFFPEKAKYMKDCWIVIGYDTATRLCDPKYFGGSVSGVVRAMTRIQDSGCRLLVASRASDAKAGTGKPLQLDDMLDRVPKAFGVRLSDGSERRAEDGGDSSSPLFVAIPQSLFLLPTSATAIRKAAAGGGGGGGASGSSE